jgi:hypothetical protein
MNVSFEVWVGVIITLESCYAVIGLVDLWCEGYLNTLQRRIRKLQWDRILLHRQN